MTSEGNAGADYGTRLRRWRNEHRLTQEQLAEKLGYDVSYIRKLEAGTRPPTRPLLARMSDVARQSDPSLFQAFAPEMARPPIPQPPDRLIGRDDTVESIGALLMGPARCVTLVGPPGIGKTRVAMAVASRLIDLFADGVCWVPLLDVGSSDEVAGHVLRTLGIAKPASGTSAATVVNAVRNQNALLVLDNFEHVIGAQSLVSNIVAGAGHVRVLVTSRQALDLVSENVIGIEPLAFPDPTTQPSLESVRSSFAVELFLARAKMARATFKLNAANCDAVLAACAHLDGIPLAIVVTADAVKTMDAKGLLAWLDKGLDLRHRGPTDVAQHHRTLEAAIGWSWERLPGDEQDLLASLAVFSGGATATALATVAGVDVDAAGSLLAQLCRKSLVDAQPDAASGPRFDLLEYVRRFLVLQLERTERGPTLRRRHRDYFVQFAQAAGAGLVGADQVHCAHAFGDEFENLALAFDSAINDDPVGALTLAASSWRYFLIRDIPTGQRWLDAALAVADLATASRAAALAAAGALGWVTGHAEVASRHLAEAASLADELQLADVSALVLVNRGALAEQQDRFDDAEHYFASALSVYRDLNDRRGQAVALNGLGMVNRRRAQLDKAWPLWMEAAALFHQVGDGTNEALTMGNLARAAEVAGRLEEAEAISLKCRSIQIALDDRRGQAATAMALARIARVRGRYADATALQLEALTAFRRLGDRPWIAATLLALGAVSEQTGAPGLAVTLTVAAERLWEQMGTRPREEDRALLDTVVQRCRRSLDEGSYARASTAGRVSSIAELAVMVAGASEPTDVNRR